MNKTISSFFLIIVFVAVSILGGSFVYFRSAASQGLKNSASPNCARNPAPGKFNAAPYYTGPLFETHLHIPAVLPPPKIIRDNIPEGYAVLGEEVTIEKIVCLMDRENITRAVGFFPYMDFPVIRKPFVDIVKRTVELYGERIIPFLAPVSFVDPVPAPDTLQKAFDENEIYQGYGEVTFYKDAYKDLSPDDPMFLESYDMLEERGLMVMIHPAQGQVRALETAFVHNPDVTFMLHGMNQDSPFNRFLRRYPNVYYTHESVPNLFFEAQSKEEFIREMEENFHVLLEEEVFYWKDIIETNPHKFMWGTDRFITWSYDEEVGRVLEEFTRAFIGRLRPAVQEFYAYKNAERLFGNK